MLYYIAKRKVHLVLALDVHPGVQHVPEELENV